MKLCFLTFAIAAMVQVSVAAPLVRHKRNDLFVNTFQETVNVIKEFLPKTETVLKNSLKDIPKTPAYARYVQLIEDYLADMQESKNTPGNCFEKNMIVLEKFGKFSEEIEKDGETPETKELERIFTSNGGEEMLKGLEGFQEKLNNPELAKSLKDISPEDALQVIPLIVEVC